MRKLDLQPEKIRIIAFIRDYLNGAGFAKVVLGLSGGVDSAVCAALAVEALGKENVIAALLPYKSSHPDSLADAADLARQLGIEQHVIEITPMADAYFNTYEPAADALRRGNWLARTRMCVLYDLSARHRALVLGTSNRSELLVGYFTQYGDSACAFEPIGHLYKTEVWELARLLGIPDKIINKTPTADLWSGQSDEADLGLSYPVLDDILYALTELDVNAGASENLDHPAELYQKVDRMITNSAFKRKLPPVLED
ncbi:MAG: NAD+ synthase [Candidatus Cloacimonetes bacterium]|nr:NAD+ synthase [Candidatus Cloacimonadota bacterium]